MTAIRNVRALPVTPGMPVADPAAAIHKPFFKAGIAVVLTLGAAWGAWLLLQIALSGEFAAVGLHEVNAHGHAQIFGWVGLFVMGFAYQAFPRFKQARLALPRVAYATLGMMLGGLVVRSIAHPLAATHSWLWWPAVAASALEVAAVVLFAVVIATTWRQSGKPLAFYDYFIISAIGWFILQAIYESIYLAVTLVPMGERELIHLVATWQPPLRDVQIHGFAMLMILGVSQRILRHFYAFPEPSHRLSAVALILLNAAVLSEVAAGILMRTVGREWLILKYGAILTIAATVTVLVVNWKLFTTPPDRDRSLKFIRAAYVWLFVSLAMLIVYPAYQFGLVNALAPTSDAARIGFSHAWFGAARHAITVGFVSLMIVGVAAKVVPTLNGIRTEHLSALWAPFLLINLGCALRVTSQSLTDFTTVAFPTAGLSGMLEVTGLALWGGHLWLIMSGRPRLRPNLAAIDAPPSADGRIRADETVGAVLERHPELLDVFVGHGFTMLTDPAMRKTLARVVTVSRACQRMGIDRDELLGDLNRHIRRDEVHRCGVETCGRHVAH